MGWSALTCDAGLIARAHGSKDGMHLGRVGARSRSLATSALASFDAVSQDAGSSIKSAGSCNRAADQYVSTYNATDDNIHSTRRRHWQRRI